MAIPDFEEPRDCFGTSGVNPRVYPQIARLSSAAQIRSPLRLVWSAGGHRADFERERDRAERLMTELLKSTADTIAAREATARLKGELMALRTRPWWKRLVG